MHAPQLDQCGSTEPSGCTDPSDCTDQSDSTGRSDCTGMLQHKVASLQALSVQSPVSRFMTCVSSAIAVNDSVCKRHMIAPGWRRPWGCLCPKLLGHTKHWFIWWGQWVSCSCCRPVMVTIQELIASTGLPPHSKERLWRVMQQYGYADGNAVVVGVRRLTPERLEAAAWIWRTLP